MDRSYRFLLCALACILVLSPQLQVSLACGGMSTYYSQCDPMWAQDMMGGDADICQEGCAMTSIAMALASCDVSLNGSTVNPKSLNIWLKENHGYHCINGNCNNMVLDSIKNISKYYRIEYFGELKPVPPMPTLIEWMTEMNRQLIAHVRNGTHFVLVVGIDRSASIPTFVVNDPYYPVTTYAYKDVVDIIVYDIMQISDEIGEESSIEDSSDSERQDSASRASSPRLRGNFD